MDKTVLSSSRPIRTANCALQLRRRTFQFTVFSAKHQNRELSYPRQRNNGKTGLIHTVAAALPVIFSAAPAHATAGGAVCSMSTYVCALHPFHCLYSWPQHWIKDLFINGTHPMNRQETPNQPYIKAAARIEHDQVVLIAAFGGSSGNISLAVGGGIVVAALSATLLATDPAQR